jgi:3'-phosphoadenosine 5'-phosphosulfate sulfotransferase (PAPS reductase)/FAD synthetase
MLAAVPAKRILVGLSGGKDSLVTLALAVEHFGAANVETFFMRLVPDLEVESGPVRRAARRFGVRLHEVAHPGLSKLIRDGVLRDPHPDAAKVRLIKELDVYNSLRARTGIDWIAGGHRCVESVVRNAWLGNIRGCDAKSRRVFPIYLWKTPSVMKFLHVRGIQIPPAIAAKRKGQSGGIELSPFCMSWLKKNHPSDYAKVKVRFPYVDTLLIKQQRVNAEAAC